MYSISTKAALLVLGWVLVGVSIGALIALDLGVAPYDVLNTGIAKFFGITPGTAVVATGIILALISWIAKVPPRVGTFFGAFTIGAIIDLTLKVFTTPTGYTQTVLYALGFICLLYLGIAFSITSGLGSGPPELAMLVLVSKNLSPKSSRLLLEVFFLGLGVYFGGSVGIATIAIVLLAPFVLSFFLVKTKAFKDLILGN